MLIETLAIINKKGLHARAAAKLATLANQHQARIQARVGQGNWADAKSVMSLMLLAASMGTNLEVSCEGDDADTAMEAIRALIADRFDEGE
jgi:phosphocarrier protein HPr